MKNVEKYCKENDVKLPTRAEIPPTSNYELSPTDAAYYQSLIGILRWMVELGRVDICCEVSMMSSHLALPREGHFAQLFRIFSYLRKYHNSEMVFDPSDPAVDEKQFERKDWTSSDFGLDLKEEVPSNMPKPRGQGFVMRAYVDALQDRFSCVLEHGPNLLDVQEANQCGDEFVWF